MADPLSITGTAVGVASLGIQVTQSLLDFYRTYINRDSELAGITGRLESLVDIFRHLEDALSSHTFKEKQQSLVKSVETSITNCNDMIQELRDECQTFRELEDTSSKFKNSMKLKGRQMTYPFRQSTLLKLDEDIREIRANLSFTLNVLQLGDTQRSQEDTAEMISILELIRTDQISSGLRDWLHAPDAFVDHNAACAKKYPGTGLWLLKGDQFSRWLQAENSIIWLKGFPGSGKSVLCSTAIQFVLQHRRCDPRIGIAFFYFTFNNDSKQNDGYIDLIQLHKSYHTGIPASPVLLVYLRRLIQRFQQVYIFLDALDESPKNEPRERVLDAVETLRVWGLQGLHLLVTSRDEPDIRERLDLHATQQITLQNSEVAADITNFINKRLDGDQRFQKLSPYRDKIREALTKGAAGVFRWVECQLQSLLHCPRSEHYVDQILSSLPQTLEETYARILCSVPEYLIEDTRRVLTLLSYALRPLTVQELIDGVAVVVKGSPGLDRQRRLQDFHDIQVICPSFLDLGHRHDRFTKTTTQTVRIAHFSIQEYLKIERIQDQNASSFSLNSVAANTQIAQICLIYLLEDGICSSNFGWRTVLEFPLARYAARYWYEHYQAMVEHAPEVESLITRMFQHEFAFMNWVKLYNADSGRSLQFELRSDEVPTPIYYASLLGLDRTLSELITANTSENLSTSASTLESTPRVSAQIENVVIQPKTARQFGEDDYKMHAWFRRDAIRNAQIGRYDNALVAASAQGHTKAVKLLLETGANTKRKGRRYGKALQQAVSGNHYRVAQILLEKGADMKNNSGEEAPPLQRASHRGYDKIVKLLLEYGADVNGKGQAFAALGAASFKGHYQVVQELLKSGADVNDQDGYVQSALLAASRAGHGKIMILLLKGGADVNAQLGARWGNALHAASSKGQYQAVQILLDAGADVNAQGGWFQNALQAASVAGHEEVMTLLLQRGADVNAHGGKFFNSALQAAGSKSHDGAIEILHKWGATEPGKGIRETAPDRCFPSPDPAIRRASTESVCAYDSSAPTHIRADPIDLWECSNLQDFIRGFEGDSD